MSDRNALDGWVQARHLQLPAIESYRQAFTSHPARVLVLKDFLLAPLAERLSRFLSNEAQFNMCYGLYSRTEKDGNISDISAAAWEAAEAGERFYRFSDYVGVRDEFQASPNRTSFQQFFSALRDIEFKRYFEKLSGLELGAPPLINAYSYKAGDFLSLHSDDVKRKRLSFVFYLSSQWEQRFGGLLHLIDGEGTVTEVAPDFNSLVIFDVAAKTKHFISPVEQSAGDRARLTISGWLLAP